MATPTYHGLSVGPQEANAIRHRVEQVCKALRIPTPAADGAMASDTRLIRFAVATRQSLDWLVLGDPAAMIRSMHNSSGRV